MQLEELSKNTSASVRDPPQVTISEAATQGYSTVVPPSGKIQPIRAFLPAFYDTTTTTITTTTDDKEDNEDHHQAASAAAEAEIREQEQILRLRQQQQQQRKFIISMSSNTKAVTLEELQKGGGGSFTIKPAVTIAAVGRHRFAYHSCIVCRKKTNQNTEGCAQHPDADIKARYCLRIQLKQDDISMWVTAFANIAESLLGVRVEDFEALDDDQRRTVVWPVIGMQYNMTMRKTVGGMYTNYTVESVCLPCE